jgi:hypothetical protein
VDYSERERLTNLIEEDGGKNWWVPEAFTIYILPRLPKELKVVGVPPQYQENYNCFVYAFGLQNYNSFLGGKNPVQQEFIKHLLNNHVLEVIESPIVGDLVFYRDSEGNITHGGIVKLDTIVISKWMWGPIIENRVEDMPTSFGEDIFYTKSLPLEKTLTEYEAYKNSGVEIKPIL